ncbi:MAG TPA: inositol monophosphatase family protein, partial [Agitococcus sp.]|nr:inositol monophosphatase family protein [Agitococcus sp.]
MQPMLTMAVRAAKQAGELIAKAAQQLQFVDVEVEAKGINDFVTRVDRDAERLIIENLRKAYPIHGFQGEESGLIEGQGVGKDWLWIIDPLDGTTNFIHGFPQYAVSIAVQYKGQTEHAVVYNPITEECFSASRGHGTTLNGRRL